MNWIENIIRRSAPIVAGSKLEEQLIVRLIDIASKRKNVDSSFGETMAAFYDLAISAVYYTNITNSGWLYCNEGTTPKLILPFVNCCPIHALKGDFVFHKSSKPTSAKIGQATTRVLLLFYQELFNIFNKNIKVLKAAEPADAVFIDKVNSSVFFGEIKSSPLLTPALAMECEPLTTYDKDGNIISMAHKPVDNPYVNKNELFIIIPKKSNKNTWEPVYYSIGAKQSNTDNDYAYNGIIKLLNNEDFLNTYLDYWKCSFETYGTKSESDNIFWLTNACGKPSNLPDNWTGGVTCISDEKTSVGMDRTDDIKKGIYQVLKLGSEGKSVKSSFHYKVGIVSNIHPVRHFDVYLKPIKDLIWTISEIEGITYARELPPDQPVYNLFDGIITFTKVYSRDKWVSNLLTMLK
ncbi:MAG: hypothetical protein K5842_04135 [Bacteroidales bacterium]|nr:hypothetical protein [Bacteroidales bacterium]